MLLLHRFFAALPGLALLLLNSAIQAQQFDWVRTEPVSINFNYQLVRYPVAADAAGNVAVTGYQANRVLYGSIVLGEMGLVSYTPAGALRFRRALTGASAITQLRYDAAGGLLALGIFKDSVRLGPRWVLRSTSTGTVPFLAKFDANGLPTWGIDLTQFAGNISTCTSFTTDANSFIYLACQRGNGDTDVIRYIPVASGLPQTVVHQTRAGRISSVSCAANGDIYVAGSCVDPGASFGGLAAPPPYSYTNYVARYTAFGQPRWVRLFEDSTCPTLQVVADNHGGVYVAVPQLFVNMHVGPFVTTRPNLPNEPLLARLDTAGTWLWLRQPPTTPAGTAGGAISTATPSLAVDAQGNAVLAASFRGSINWGVGTTAVGGSSTFNPDALALSYGPTGSLLWVRNGGGSLVEEAHGLALAPGGDLYLTGYSTSGALTFGAAQGGPTAAATEFFVTHLAARPTAVRTGLAGAWAVAPNPIRQADAFVRFAPGAALPNALELRDALGRLLRTMPVMSAETRVLTAGLTPGLYVLQATAGATRYQARLAVE